MNIRACSEKDRKNIEKFLSEEPVYHTFLLSDLECYGFDKEFQQVYMQECDGVCRGIALRYYQNLILSDFTEAVQCEEISRLIGQEVTTVMGKAEIVEQVAEYRGRKEDMVCNIMYVHQHMKAAVKKDGVIRKAVESDVDRIYEFLMSFPEMQSLYSAKGMIENRIRGKEGIHVVMEKGGEIIAHGNTAASAKKTCMIGGICVKETERNQGYAKEILHTLCREIRGQGKIPCMFTPEKEQYSIFEDMGFEPYGKWGVVRV